MRRFLVLFAVLGVGALTQPLSAQVAAPVVRSVRVSIPSASVLTLNATPYQLVAAPGSGRMLILEGVEVYKAAGVADAGVAAGEDISIKYTNGSGLEQAVIETTGFLDQTSAQVRYARFQTGAITAGTVTSFVPVANAALVAHMLTGEIITGDSAVVFRVYYRNLPSTL
jgi:hypothetical protein